MSSCDRCEYGAEFYLYSAYEAGGDSVHPLVHRYAGAMWRACSRHVAVLLASDREGTPEWVVSRESLPLFPAGWGEQ